MKGRAIQLQVTESRVLESKVIWCGKVFNQILIVLRLTQLVFFSRAVRSLALSLGKFCRDSQTFLFANKIVGGSRERALVHFSTVVSWLKEKSSASNRTLRSFWLLNEFMRVSRSSFPYGGAKVFRHFGKSLRCAKDSEIQFSLLERARRVIYSRAREILSLVFFAFHFHFSRWFHFFLFVCLIHFTVSRAAVRRYWVT